jgi:hypothetical protein
MLIIGLATPMLLSGIAGSLTYARRSYEQGAATAWVQGEVEFLRRHCYEDLRLGARKITASVLAPGEPPLPDGFSAAHVVIEAAGPGYLQATVALYKEPWDGETPDGPAAVQTTTFIGDLKVAGACP